MGILEVEKATECKCQACTSCAEHATPSTPVHPTPPHPQNSPHLPRRTSFHMGGSPRPGDGGGMPPPPMPTTPPPPPTPAPPAAAPPPPPGVAGCRALAKTSLPPPTLPPTPPAAELGDMWPGRCWRVGLRASVRPPTPPTPPASERGAWKARMGLRGVNGGGGSEGRAGAGVAKPANVLVKGGKHTVTLRSHLHLTTSAWTRSAWPLIAHGSHYPTPIKHPSKRTPLRRRQQSIPHPPPT